MSAVRSSRSVCQHQRACTFAYRHVSMLARQQPVSRSCVWKFAYRYVRMSASAYLQGVSISVSASTPTCQHVKMSASQSVFKPVYHHVSVSARQVVSVSAGQCQRTSTPTWLPASMSTCENVGMSGCERFISVNMSLSHCLGVSACQHVSVFNYNMTSEIIFPKNPEDYNCIVTTVLNVLHPFWSCILFSFCVSFESSSKFLRGQMVSLVGFFKVQVKLQWKQKWNIVWPGSMKPDLVM